MNQPAADIQPSDIQRIEGMFNKTIWVIGLVWAATFGGGMYVTSSVLTQVRESGDKAEERIEAVAAAAESSIKEASSDAANTAAKQIAEKVDVERLVDDLKSERIPKIETQLAESVQQIKDRVSKSITDTDSRLRDQENTVKKLSVLLQSVVQIQELARDIKVELRDIGVEPFYPDVGQPAQMTATVRAPYLDDSAILPIKVEFKAFGITKEVEDKILGSNELALSVPIIIPSMSEMDDQPLGEGKYAFTVTVRSGDGQLILDKDSELVNVRNATK